jgi:hypothetical protein
MIMHRRPLARQPYESEHREIAVGADVDGIARVVIGLFAEMLWPDDCSSAAISGAMAVTRSAASAVRAITSRQSAMKQSSAVGLDSAL